VADPPDPSDRIPDGVAERIADTMFALSTPSRLQILACLRGSPRTVSEIVAAVGMEQSAVSHQLRVLRDHSVVTMRRLGRRRQYAVRDEHIAALIDSAEKHVRALDRPPLEEPDSERVGDVRSSAS
jgi:ArsR family transcriptional regulator, nickel/cobalt-responsive transcriptional repressor